MFPAMGVGDTTEGLLNQGIGGGISKTRVAETDVTQ